MEKTFARSIIQSIGKVLTLPVKSTNIQTIELPVQLSDISVLIGTVGESKGTVTIHAPESTFKRISGSMYGVEVEGDMLFSFAGELSNIIAGNAATILSGAGVNIDISPPSVLEGSSYLRGLTGHIQEITFLVDNSHEMKLIISYE